MNPPAADWNRAGTQRVWCARVPATDAGMPADLYRSWLTDAEAERMAQFRTPALRRQHLVTRALCRAVLSRHHPVAPGDWRFEIDANGRPGVVAPSAGRDLCFSLSNTADWVACIVARAPAEVGIDIEHIDGGAADPGIAARYFAPGEAASLADLDEAAARRRFMQLWTLKEAYAKARGLGLSLALDRFAIEPDASPIHLRCDAGIDADAGGWRFDQRPLGGDHLLAVARRGCPDVPIEVVAITP